MMTVLNELENEQSMNKYHHLTFIEFLDFLCRMAMVGFKILDATIEDKVHVVVSLIY